MQKEVAGSKRKGRQGLKKRDGVGIMKGMRAVGAALCIGAALLFAAPMSAWSQGPGPTQATDGSVDPALARQKRLRELINRAREQLYVNRNPRAALETCREALRIDPNNQTAQFFLRMAERQLKGEVTTSTRTRVSSLPDEEILAEAVARARASTHVIVLGPDALSSGAVGAAGGMAGKGYLPPRARPVWLTTRNLMWVASALLALIFLMLIAVILDRLLTGKRHRQAYAEFSERIRAASSPSAQAAAAEAPFVPVATDDFDLGTPASSTEEEPVEVSTPTIPEDREIDLWKEEKSEPTSAETTSETPTQEEVEPISSSEVFGPDEPIGEQPVAEPPAGAETAGAGPAQADFGPTPFSGPAPGTAASDLPVSPSPTAEEDEPIALEGISVETGSMETTEEEERQAAEKQPLRSELVLDDVPIEPEPKQEAVEETAPEELPFSLDVELEQTDSIAEDDYTAPPLESVDAPPSEEPTSLRLESGYPMLEEESAETKEQIAKSQPPQDEQPATEQPPSPEAKAEPPDQPSTAENVPQTYHDEILISTGSQKTSTETAPLAGEQITSESTMVNSEARHKAVFQDQLARGLAAMEEGRWKDAVKYLSVAHAMDPTDEYALAKLREARKMAGKQSPPPE